MVHLSVAAAAAAAAAAEAAGAPAADPLDAEPPVSPAAAVAAASCGLVLAGGVMSEEDDPCRPLVTLFPVAAPLPDERRLLEPKKGKEKRKRAEINKLLSAVH